MKKALGLGVALLLVGGVAARAEDKHEDLLKEQVRTMKQLADLLTTVKDEDSLKAARPKLKTLNEQANAAIKKSQALGAPPREQAEALQKRYEKELKEVIERLFKETARLKTIKGGPELIKELQRGEGSKPPDRKADAGKPADK